MGVLRVYLSEGVRRLSELLERLAWWIEPDPPEYEHSVPIPMPSGMWITAQAALDLPPASAASAVGLTLAEYLAALEAWANGIGLPYGYGVDREQGRFVDRAAHLRGGGS